MIDMAIKKPFHNEWVYSDYGDIRSGNQDALSYRNEWAYLDYGKIHNGNQDAFRNELAFLIIAISTMTTSTMVIKTSYHIIMNWHS